MLQLPGLKIREEAQAGEDGGAAPHGVRLRVKAGAGPFRGRQAPAFQTTAMEVNWADGSVQI